MRLHPWLPITAMVLAAVALGCSESGHTTPTESVLLQIDGVSVTRWWSDGSGFPVSVEIVVVVKRDISSRSDTAPDGTEVYLVASAGRFENGLQEIRVGTSSGVAAAILRIDIPGHYSVRVRVGNAHAFVEIVIGDDSTLTVQ